MFLKIKKIIKYCLYTVYAILNYFSFVLAFKRAVNKAEIVFFFPYYHTGGAERVHIDILNAIKNKNCIVVFTHHSATQNFYNAFQSAATLFEINPILNKRISWVSNLLTKTIVNAINQSKTVETVFGCNTFYFYQIIPKIDSKIQIVDLFHAFAENDSRVTEIAVSAPIVDRRIVINQKAKKDISEFYKLHGVHQKYIQKITVIPNGIVINENFIPSKDVNTIKIGFIGRWSPEKRPELFLQIAQKLSQNNPEFSFVMAGTGMKSNTAEIEKAGVTFLGEITDATSLNKLYSELHFLIIPSVYEGFPMVIMEAMHFGVIPIATNVGGISEHITHYENGILVSETNENAIVDAICNAILELNQNAKLKETIMNSALNYAKNNFNIESFNTSYQSIFAKQQ